MDSESRNYATSILKRLFTRSSKSEPLVSGVLKRNESYADAYEKWKSEGNLERDLITLRAAYETSNAFNKYNSGFQFYRSPQSSGFYFNPEIDIREDSFDFILDFFKELLLENNYRVYTSDRRQKELDHGVQQIDRHYLKPDNFSGHLPMKQEFGNVIAELFRLDGSVQYLKVMANVYSDRNFSDPRPFEKLMELIFLPIKK